MDVTICKSNIGHDFVALSLPEMFRDYEPAVCMHIVFKCACLVGTRIDRRISVNCPSISLNVVVPLIANMYSKKCPYMAVNMNTLVPFVMISAPRIVQTHSKVAPHLCCDHINRYYSTPIHY